MTTPATSTLSLLDELPKLRELNPEALRLIVSFVDAVRGGTLSFDEASLVVTGTLGFMFGALSRLPPLERGIIAARIGRTLDQASTPAQFANGVEHARTIMALEAIGYRCCPVCMCTELDACMDLGGPCSWVEGDERCSSCVAQGKGDRS